MVIDTKLSGNYSQDSFKKFLLVVLLVALTGTSSVALALPVVNLTLDDGEMDEAGLGTGKFTVTRAVTTLPQIKVMPARFIAK